MKYFKNLPIALLFLGLTMFSCKDNTNTEAAENSPVVEEQAITEAPVQTSTTVPNAAANPMSTNPMSANGITQAQPPQEPAQNAAGVWHYTCAKGHAGGAGSAVNCKTCGEPLAHNQAYHGNPTPNTNMMATPTAPVAPPMPEPAQNAKGVWHYTCSKGHAGGAGTPSPCATCGTTLAHNAVYHQ